MTDDTTLGAVVLGLDGFTLLDAQLIDAEAWLYAETTAARTGCRDCGVVATARARGTVQLRDLPMTGRPCRLLWVKRVWRCHEPRCRMRTWTPTAR